MYKSLYREEKESSVYLYPYVYCKYMYTILFYDKDGSVIRFNNVAFKTKPNAAGGLGKDRFDKNEKAADFLAKKYPKIVTKKRRKNGRRWRRKRNQRRWRRRRNRLVNPHNC